MPINLYLQAQELPEKLLFRHSIHLQISNKFEFFYNYFTKSLLPFDLKWIKTYIASRNGVSKNHPKGTAQISKDINHKFFFFQKIKHN